MATSLIESSIESGSRLAHAESWTAQQVLAWAAESFGDRAAICSSFQVEGMVVLDMAQQMGLGLRVFTIDTGRLPDETLELIDRVRDHYGIEVEVYHPDQAALSQLTTSFGVNSFYKSVSLRMRCCEIRKVDPLDSVLLGLDAWITGIRRDHTTSRSSAQRIEVDEGHGGIIKVNPLVDWTEGDVWEYVRRVSASHTTGSTTRDTPASGARPVPAPLPLEKTPEPADGGGSMVSPRSAAST